MRRSITSSCRRIELVVIAATLSFAVFLRAQDFIDDFALTESFQEKFGELLESGEIVSAESLRSQLRSQPAFAASLPKLPESGNLSSAAIYERAKSASLILGHLYLCGKCDKLHSSLAGAILVSPDGVALTNYHVLQFDRAEIFGAMSSSGVAYPVTAVLASSKKDDVALVQLGAVSDVPFVPLAPSTEVGENIFVVSHPDSHFFSFSKGIVSRYFLSGKARIPRLQITADFARGSSGSGVLNESGQLVGLVCSTSSIYYSEEKNAQKNLQMVVKSCVPLSSIRNLFKNGETAELTPPPHVSPTSPPESDRAANADDVRSQLLRLR